MLTRLLTAVGVLLIALSLGCAADEQNEEFANRMAELEEQARQINEARKQWQDDLAERAKQAGQHAEKYFTESTMGKPTVVINLTSGKDDLHAVTMGLNLAEHTVAAGHQCVIFFNVKAPPLASKNLPKRFGMTGQKPVRQYLEELSAQGATLLVCPMCAEIMKVKPEELVSEATMITDRNQLFDHLTANTVVFTY